MRPFIALPTEEEDFMGSLGRTRIFVPGEWDDYIWLYTRDTPEEDLPDPEEEQYQCPLCERFSPTVRGLTVHLSRSHGVKSERADYFASRKES